MKKMLILGCLIAGTATAQIDLNQPLRWDTVLENKLQGQATLWRSLAVNPRSDIQSFDIIKAASGKLSGAYKETLGVSEDRLYQPIIFWNNCPYPSMSHLNADHAHNLLKQAGYKPIKISGKPIPSAAPEDQLEIWSPLNKSFPSIAISISQKCGGEENISLLTIFQIGENRHISYGKVISDRFFGRGSAKEADTRVQLRSPSGPTRPTANGNILVEVYNTTSSSLIVSLRVDVRDQSGRIINSYTDQNSLEVKGNSQRQTAIAVTGVGAYDAIVSIEGVR